MTKRLALLVCWGVWLGLIMSSQGAAAGDPALIVEVAGPPKLVFKKADDRCDPRFIPDTAARAFRDSSGLIHLVSTWQHNYAFVGKDFSDLRLNCSLLYQGKESAEPQAFDDKAWLTSFYTTDGVRIFALIHDEFHGVEHPGVCPHQASRECWLNAISSTVSLDGGKHFQHVDPKANLVAALPYAYGALPMPAGYFAPSNIVKFHDAFYVMVRTEHRGEQQGGSCLLRTSNLFDAKSWRAWNGSEFAVAFVDPYAENVAHPTEHLCAPVAPGELIWPVSSLSFHRKSQTFIAIMQANVKFAKWTHYEDGVYYSTSSNLIDWSTPKLFLPTTSKFTFTCSGPEPIMHPSLIDPDSPDRNFSETGDAPSLYYSLIHPNKCRLSFNIDMMQVKLAIKPAK